MKIILHLKFAKYVNYVQKITKYMWKKMFQCIFFSFWTVKLFTRVSILLAALLWSEG